MKVSSFVDRSNVTKYFILDSHDKGVCGQKGTLFADEDFVQYSYSSAQNNKLIPNAAFLYRKPGKNFHIIGGGVQRKEKSEAPDRTLFVITTDGYENSSEEYTYDMVKEMVQRQQNVFDWEFIFLGANIDAVKEGGRLGVRASRSARFHNDGEGIERNYDTVNNVVRSMCCKEIIRDDCLDPIRDDYEKRNKE